MDETGIEGRVALVTGAARGIGAAVARTLARRGAQVAVLDRDAEALREVAEALARARAYPVDVTDSSAVDGAVAAVERDLGPISIAVNVAGILRTAPAVEVTDTDWAETFAVNAGGVLHVLPVRRGPNAAQARRGDRDGRLQRRGCAPGRDGRLRRIQGGRIDVHEVSRPGVGGPRDPLQRRRARLDRHRPAASIVDGRRQPRPDHLRLRAGVPGRHPARPDRGARRRGRRRGIPGLRPRPAHHHAGPVRRRRRHLGRYSRTRVCALVHDR